MQAVKAEALVLTLGLFVTHCMIGKSFGQTLNNTNELYTDLTQNYNKNIRGIINQADSTIIQVKFHLSNINDYDIVNSRFSLAGYLTFQWIDQRMTWDPAKYGNVESVTFPQNDVWIPNIILGNSNRDDGLLYLGDDEVLVRYAADGSAYWYPGHLFQAYCPPNVKDFPFDTQVFCNLLKIKHVFKNVLDPLHVVQVT